MTWSQDYDPLHAWPLSTLVSALPVVTLFFALIVLKTRVWVAALAGLLMAVGLAWLVFGMPAALVAGGGRPGRHLRPAAHRLDHRRLDLPVSHRRGDGAVPGDEGVDRGPVGRQAAATDPDRLLLRSVPGRHRRRRRTGGDRRLVPDRAGLRPVPGGDALPARQHRAGGLGWRSATRSATLAAVTGLPEPALSAMTGRILPPLSAILPLWLVRSMVGWRETLEVWPALAVSGLSFAGMQFYWSNYQESGLVDIIAALVSLLTMVAFLKIWRPRTILENAVEAAGASARSDNVETRVDPTRRHSIASVLKGWSPFLLASVFIFVWAQPWIASYLTSDALEAADADPASCGGSRPAGGPRADARGRDRRPECPLTARHGGLPGRGPGGAGPGHEPGADRPDFRPDGDPPDPVAAGDQLHGRPGLRHAILGHGYGPRPEPDPDRPRLSLSSAPCSAGWAWR